jgi:hypothetical protein
MFVANNLNATLPSGLPADRQVGDSLGEIELVEAFGEEAVIERVY